MGFWKIPWCVSDRITYLTVVNPAQDVRPLDQGAHACAFFVFALGFPMAERQMHKDNDYHPDERLAYRPAEAARLIGYSRSGFYLLLSNGELPSFKLGRKRLIRRSDLLEFMRRAVASAAPPHDGEEGTS
ncbi:helix-turn-helix domain-containing protein [Bradyrhizobium sp. SZCCHNR2035]|uniref:helix-turn-helix domain-containing protein n=1 Tax=Bradyrhizobium sp. SZCCHNR2035 TaxID=3057386 RepID=UPI002915F500|nr:helix-turn-helix domain-containing protein [Bradyrhizobium sp. SZCCHNR2035]